MNLRIDFSELKYFLSEIDRLKQNARYNLLNTTETIMENMKDRISDGLDMNGNTVSTFSARQIGNYSERHGLIRQRAGKQTAKVDFQFSGQLFDNITVEQRGVNTVVGGIQGDRNVLVANENEDYFEKVIFTPSDAEIEKELDEMLNSLFK